MQVYVFVVQLLMYCYFCSCRRVCKQQKCPLVHTVRFKQDLCPAHQTAYLRPHSLRRGSFAPPCSAPVSASVQSRPGADGKLALRMCAQLALHR